MILMVEGIDRLIVWPSGQLSLIGEFQVSKKLHINKKNKQKNNQKTHHQPSKTSLRRKRWLRG